MAVLAHGGALVAGYQLDDYLFSDKYAPTDAVVGQGRFITAAVVKILQLLHLSTIDAYLFGAVLAIGAQVVLAYALIRVARLSLTLNTLLAGALFVANPYMAEILAWRGIHITYALAAGLCALAVYFAFSGQTYRWRLVGMIVATVGYLSIYQTFLNFVVIAVIGLFAAGSLADKSVSFLRLSSAKLLALGTLAGTVLYYLLLKALVLLGVSSEDSRAGFIGLSDLSSRVGEVLGTTGKVLMRDEQVMPLLLKVLLLLALAIGVTASRGFSVRPLIWSVGCVVAMPLLVVGLMLPLAEWWPVPRVIAHVALIFAILYLFASTSTTGIAAIAQKTVAAFVVIGMILVSNGIFRAEQVNNRIDANNASEMISRAHSLGADDSYAWLFVGQIKSYPRTKDHVQGDLNVSAFATDWSARGIISSLVGRDVPAASISSDSLCASVGAWPAADSVLVVEKTVVVCLK